MPRLFLIVIFGLIATGKTTVAKALAQATGWPVLHSDVIRKELAGIPPTQRVAVPYGQGIYSPEFSGRTYAEMFHRAKAWLAQGQSVILDGSFMRAADRETARQLAAAQQAQPVFLLCTCPWETVRQRLLARQRNREAVSNGRLEILAAQQQAFQPPEDLVGVPFLEVTTDRPLPLTLQAILDYLKILETRQEEEYGGPGKTEGPGAPTGQG